MCRMQAGLLPVSFALLIWCCGIAHTYPDTYALCTACGSQSSKIKRSVRSFVSCFNWAFYLAAKATWISAIHSLTRACVWTPTICDAVSSRLLLSTIECEIAILATRVSLSFNFFFKRFVEFLICFCRSFQFVVTIATVAMVLCVCAILKDMWNT